MLKQIHFLASTAPVRSRGQSFTGTNYFARTKTPREL